MEKKKRKMLKRYMYYDRVLWDKIILYSNYEENITFEELYKIIAGNFNIGVVEGESDLVEGKENHLFLFPVKGELPTLEVYIEKRKISVLRNKLINLIKTLIEEHKIKYAQGCLAYNSEDHYIFININNVFNGIMGEHRNIFLNYDKIKCLYKSKNDGIMTLICETKSSEKPKEQEYRGSLKTFSFKGKNNGCGLEFTGSVLTYKSKVACLEFAQEKFNVFTRRIYAKDEESALLILKDEMENLGFKIENIRDLN